jgi:hypothetical protein
MKGLLTRFTAYFARLSPLERRFIVLAVVVAFAVINLWFVLPRFDDWARVRNRHAAALRTLEKYGKEIAQIPAYTNQIARLESEGSAVALEDQSLNFLTTIQNQAVASGVNILASTRQPDRTNQFFLERAQGLTIAAGEAQLVDFLYKLGEGNSLIRVRALSLRPDAPRQALGGNITLIASYQKKPAAKLAPPKTAKPPAAASSPVPASAPAARTNKVVLPAAAPKPATPTKK